MPAHEGQRVAAAWIGDGNTGVARDGDARRHAGNDFEPDALLVQEQRLGAAAVEEEGIAPLQAGDGFPLARLFGEEVADRFLLQRLRRRHADVNLLRVGPRISQQPRRDEMVVQDDIRRRKTLHSANGNQPGVTRAGADQVDS